MSLPLIDNYSVTFERLSVKFGRSIRVDSIDSANISVFTDSATPTVFDNPFRQIEVIRDYNQVTKVLTLYWTRALFPDTEYIVSFSNFRDPLNRLIPTESITFTTEAETATPSFVAPQPPMPQEVMVVDRSVRTDILTSYQIIAKNPDFYVKETVPSNGDFYLDNSENKGRVIIRFNQRPAGNFLSNRYFKAQRKKIQVSPSRWEIVPVRVSIHSWKSEVYVDFPSLEGNSYYEDGQTYYESGYKYRIILSEKIGV